MSDSKEDKPVLGRKPLGIKRTVESGQVQQQFSHGRKNTVVVEVKRRRVLGKPGEAAGAAPAAAPQADPVPAAPAPAAPRPAAPPPPQQRAPQPAPARQSPPQSLMSRQELQAKLLREAEEARMNALEEARRREAAERIAAAEDEKRRAEENRQAAEAAASAPAVEEAKAPEAAPAPEAPAAAAPQDSAAAPEAAAPTDEQPAATTAAPPPPRRFTPVTPIKRPEPAKPERAKRGEDNRRQAGKLTVTKALADDDSARARSLAALKRAREKERRAHYAGGSKTREKQSRDVVVPEVITVQELANRMAEKGADLVKSLFKMGQAVTLNQSIDQDTAELLVEEFGHRIQRVSEADVEIGIEGDVDPVESLKVRAPVVTIMGHVDHGKTSLLDALRGTDVVAGESGGITQHIGAYQVTTKGGDIITFLDTPGHEAFSEMRARGANVTDIVILVVAADDGLMPQTIEAINHTKAAGVPMIVAINKCDKPEANPQKVRERLLEHEIVVEDMGGDVQDVQVSALKKTGLDELIEKILLQAELMELTANPDRAAEGNVIEAQLDKGRGAVATVLVRRGTLKVGDTFVIGAESGKVRALVNDKGQQVKSAGPSVPVEVLGLSGVPMAGDQMTVVENEARAREVAAYRQEQITRKRTASVPTNFENMFSALSTKVIEYPVVIRGDVQGSVEAIVNALNRISTDEIKVRILSSGVGAITESDVTLASASRAPLIGFNVRPNAKARPLAIREKISLRYYDVIYDLLEEVRNEMAGQLAPERIETIVGRAEVLQVFPAGKKDKAAGLLVKEGVIRKGLNARLTRDDVIVSKTVIHSLRRFKDDVSEVRAGMECGAVLQDTNDIKPGDTLELFEVEERVRTL
ncbi:MULTISPECIES: translation initiation factor IF-2 [unclassified Sphingobium]|uniref:translation initiation factor IF-2 n=1 Tax=unclassified Sphingobium TaxID=2611147 RepID=UPI000D154729|nr:MULTISPECIES: translation initiation factor IF-2 [unclassified Sphingobium]MBG6117419.1 translation initiation factor IF-2 [Sphingobium sp. JAI105]PSO12497.1 translation initiation factor IF-2 [Sphingobium sp. AEW4]TWD09670.1 translation initiation factor 2 (bIF-2) [Sphingobium sp. AEW010]TWD21069.1 translation initiation factor 2 (bIF-2) [Sphingobium sp. AEW001]TWD26341.1 translation initiation factor 2 (bIF-2) [Sphingobium sp. AEW013]